MRAGIETMGKRNLLLLLGAGALCVLLLAVAFFRALTEAGGTNAYALVAEGLLSGRSDVSACFGADCGMRDGKTYIVFPPFPALLAMPLVALFGIYTKGFVALSIALWAAALALWNRIFRSYGLSDDQRLWLVAAIGFASPLYYVVLRGDGVWFFAQSVAFFFIALAIHEVVVGRRPVTAGLALGCALLSRQMSIFYAPLLLLLAFRPDEPLLRITAARIAAAFKLGLPILAALAVYLAYNYWRFGDPLDSGYNTIQFTADGSVLGERVAAYGLWNIHYVPFNLFYFLLQGFHADFTGPARLTLGSLDNAGTAILAASPWLLLLFFTRLGRIEFFALLLIAGFSAALLFYHSNGFSQYNAQRYVLDWLPAALLVLVPALTQARLEIFRLLVTWGVVLNVATVAVLALTKSG
ncbi:hypothetical protein [Taklimakanibacter lacteus]|uniref:hypothetical protein n=1 Tax=Taklimakanibacter lacteus TaxID=2268456 RepID=UPI000E666ADC